MCKVVIDTNVLISSRLSELGNPSKIMELIADGKVTLCYCPDILDEYKRVLAYSKFNFSIEYQRLTIEDIENVGEIIEPSISEIQFNDYSDRIFYDTAKTADTILVTGNIKHFPNEPFIMTPADFLSNLEE